MHRGCDFAVRMTSVVLRIEDGKGRGVYELTTACEWLEKKASCDVRSWKRERERRFFAFVSGDK